MASNERLYSGHKAPSPAQPPRAGSNAIQVDLRDLLYAMAHRVRMMHTSMPGPFTRRTRSPASFQHPTSCVEVFSSNLLGKQRSADIAL